jgi:hypothetical protein
MQLFTASEMQSRHHWRPELPLSEVAPDAIQKAEKLRRVLAVALNQSELSGSERDARAVEEFKKVFGYSVTDRYIRKLVKRTKDRAGDASDWTPLEFYLDDHPRPKFMASEVAPSHDFRAIAEEIQRFANPLKATLNEKAVLWDLVFKQLERGAEGNERKRKRKLREFLWRNARFLAETANALRVQFDYKYEKWIKGGRQIAALLDGREAKRGEPKPGTAAFTQHDLEYLEWYARENCGGRLAQAVQELKELGDESGLTPELIQLICRQQSGKSYVNRRLREAVTPNIRATMPYRLGGRIAQNNRPKLQRFYRNMRSMQVVCADDFTWPVYFYIPDGKGWFKLLRGQCLLFIDVRSLRVLNWVLIPAEQYDSLAIRSLMNQVCMELAVPRIWYFERGLWLSSKIIKNPVPKEWNTAHSDTELKSGWENFGCKFIHATGPQAKPVEKVGGLLQNLMERYKGYCGRDERRDCPEETRRHKLAVEAQREHPHKFFFSFDEWEAELGRLIDKYNGARQDGETLRDESPDEAFEANWPHDDPPSKFDAVTWHLGAHYVREFTVGINGITFRFGKRTFKYFDVQTGSVEYHKVKAWFDPENPDYIALTDMAGKNLRIVKLHRPTDFIAGIDPGSDNARAFEGEIAKAKAHAVVARNRYHSQKAKFKLTVRPNLVDRRTAALAQEIDAARMEFKENAARSESESRAALDRARKAGIPAVALNPDRNQAAHYLKLMQEAREEAKREQESTP